VRGVLVPAGTNSIGGNWPNVAAPQAARYNVRKLIAFDDDTLAKLTQLGRDRMGTFQELADEAFADLLKKHGIPVDLKDALRKSATREAKTSAKTEADRIRSARKAAASQRKRKS
jgi:hypothetical protein